MKKLSILLLVTMMIISSIVTGCSGSNTPAENTPAAEQTPDTEPVATAAPDPFGKYDPVVTVTYARHAGTGATFPEGVDYENNIWMDEYLSELGIKVETIWTAEGNDAYDTKINLSIASNELPDMFVCNASQFQRLAENDMLEDLTKVKEDYASDFVKAMLLEDGGEAIRQCIYDGKLLALPESSVFPGGFEYVFIRDDWRKNLNMPVPKTMEDLLALSEAFITQDPDKNGKPDTYGLGISNQPFETYFALRGFFNGYGAFPGQWIEKDGKLVYGTIQPEMKNGLAKLRELYENNLLDDEFIVKDAYTVSQDAVAGKVGIAYGQFWLITWPLPDAFAADNTVDWKAYPILYADGVTDKGVNGAAKLNSYYVVRKGYKNPEVLQKLYNFFLEKIFSPDADLEKYKNDGTYNISNWTAVYTTIGPTRNPIIAKAVTEAIDKNDPSGLPDSEHRKVYDAVKGYMDGTVMDKTSWSYYRLYYGPGSIFDLETMYLKSGLARPDKFYGADTPEMQRRMSILRSNEEEMILNIITGEKPLEYFDEFVKNWNTLGGETITFEVNQWREKAQ